MYDCFHCGNKSVIWDSDFDLEKLLEDVLKEDFLEKDESSEREELDADEILKTEKISKGEKGKLCLVHKFKTI